MYFNRWSAVFAYLLCRECSVKRSMRTLLPGWSIAQPSSSAAGATRANEGSGTGIRSRQGCGQVQIALLVATIAGLRATSACAPGSAVVRTSDAPG